MVFRRSLTVTLLIGILLASCGNQEATANSTSEVDAILTAGVGTLAASIFQTQTALVPPATGTSSPTIVPTFTPAPAITLPALSPTLPLLSTQVVIVASPTPTGTIFTPTVDPYTLAYGCNNLELVRDETIPAGTVFKPNEKFTKTWKVANIGTCDWVYLYRLVFQSGNRMEGSPSSLGKVVKAGNWNKLSVNLTAPSTPGTYVGYWRFGEQSGHVFGSTLTVSIVVANPTKTPVPSTSTSVPDTATLEPATATTEPPPTATLETPSETSVP